TSPNLRDFRRVKCSSLVPATSQRCEKALLLMLTAVKHSAYPTAVGRGTPNSTTSITTAYRKHFRRPDLSGAQRIFGQSYKNSVLLMTHSSQMFLPPGPK